MTYHTPTRRPGCWLDPVDHDPSTLPVRVAWCIDGAASCRNFADPETAALAIQYTPTCSGCARKTRAELIHAGAINAHPAVKTRPVPKEAA